MKIAKIIIVSFIVFVSCAKKSQDKKEVLSSNALCLKGEITEVIGFTGFSFTESMKAKCNVVHENSNLELNIDFNLSTLDTKIPFQAGDSVVVKFDQKYIEVYLLKRYIKIQNYWLDRHYTYNDVCENGNLYKDESTYKKGILIDKKLQN